MRLGIFRKKWGYKHPFPFKHFPASTPEPFFIVFVSKRSLKCDCVHLEIRFWDHALEETHSPILKINILIKNKIWNSLEPILCIYFGLKYKFYEMLNSLNSLSQLSSLISFLLSVNEQSKSCSGHYLKSLMATAFRDRTWSIYKNFRTLHFVL